MLRRDGNVLPAPRDRSRDISLEIAVSRNLLTSASRLGLNLLAFLGGVLALHLGQTIFIPTVFALFLAAMLWPLVRGLHRYVLFSWNLACLLTVLGLMVLSLGVTLVIGLSVPKMLQDLPRPQDVEAQKAVYNKIRDNLEMISPVPLDQEYLPTDAEKSAVFHYFSNTLKSEYITDALVKLLYLSNNFLWQWVLIMFLVLFLLLEGPMLSRRFVEIFGPSTAVHDRAVMALADMARQVRTYLVWRTLVNLALALAVGLVYRWIGLRQPWTWAIFTGIFCYVPYLGPIAAGVPPVLDAFVSGDTPLVALEVLAFYVGIITLEGYVIVPVVMGRSMALNATTVILACMFWELVWGLPGLFLAMPLMSAIKAICTHVPDWRPWANLMSTEGAELSLDMNEPEKTILASDKTEMILPEKADSKTASGPPGMDRK